MCEKPTYEELAQRVRELEQANLKYDASLKSLKKEMADYRAVFDSANDAMVIHDIENGRILEVNQKVLELYGYSKKEVLELDVGALSEGISPYSQVEGQMNIRKAAEGEPHIFQWRAKRKNGDIFWAEVSLKEVVLDDKERILAIISDITDRKQKEEAFRMGEREYKTIIQTAINGFLLTDLEGNILETNEAYCRMSGYSEGELLNLNIRDLDHFEELPYSKVRIEKIKKLGHQRFEARHMRKDGKVFDLEVSAQCLSGDNGRLVIFLRDVTMAKKTERELLDAKEKYRALFDQSVEGIYLHDMEGRILDVNRMACLQSGYSRDELLRLKIFDLHPTEGESINTCKSEILHQWRQWRPGRGNTFETTHRKKDGTVMPVQISAGAVHFGEKDLVLAIVQDISDRKKSEEEKLELSNRLQQIQKMESIGNLAGGIAHDFNNILTSIIGFTQLALAEVETGTFIEESLKQVYAAGTRAGDLVKQILTFARRSNDERKPIRVDAIALETLKLLRSTIPATIEIRRKIESRSLITGNPIHIDQIFMNICTNAAHAMQAAGGILDVSLKDVIVEGGDGCRMEGMEPGKYIEIRISDTGTGIPENRLESIFEPYFTTKGPGEGTGLGLSVVHGIVESYGGKITVQSRFGQGTVFAIYLPVISKGVVEAPHEKTSLPLGTERILLVEDELSILKLESRILERLGYRVIASNSPVEALELFRSEPPAFDLVITDMSMPKMAGDHLARELIRIRPDIPVILCSGYSNRFSNKNASEIGIKALAEKPISMEGLAGTVRRVLDEGETKGGR